MISGRLAALCVGVAIAAFAAGVFTSRVFSPADAARYHVTTLRVGSNTVLMMVDRFTGAARVCDPSECSDVPVAGGKPTVNFDDISPKR